jgi:antitoxin component YwqK of YwqJK toxin-antitoxin module
MFRRTLMSKLSAAVAVSFLAIGCSKPVDVDYKELDYQQDESFNYQGKPFTGIAHEKHKNGTPSKEYPMRDGRLNGVMREWWDNGKMSAETHFEKGKRHGLNRYWDITGKLIKEQIYEHGESKSVKTY